MIFDIECDGLNPTKIHVLSYSLDNKSVISITDYDEMRNAISNEKVLIGHNIIGFDIPVIERILGIKIKAKLVDTLFLSWYLYPSHIKHGLDDWGKHFKILKPKIDDWENLSLEDYVHRCEQDVLINIKLYSLFIDYLSELYNEDYDRIVQYLSFKAKCAQKQQEAGWKLDVDKCRGYLAELEDKLVTPVSELKKAMPKVTIYRKMAPPSKPYKKDGSLSEVGKRWFDKLEELNLPKNYKLPINIEVGEEKPNPSSPSQIKAWLESLGWKPESFKYVREDRFTERKIPQVRIDGPDGKELCPSVLKIDHPAIEHLKNITVLEHRIGILKSFLDNEKSGKVEALIGGLTNTLRFKHKAPCVNLPGVSRPYGEYIRGVLISEKGMILCGSDQSSLEDMTKRHYIYNYDPEYVKEMDRPDFDPHLDLAKVHGIVTQDQINQYLAGDKTLKGTRQSYKVVNYSATYGVKPPKLSRTLNCSVKEAAKLLDVYWERNWAITKIVEDSVVKEVRGQMWLWNPVARLWYSLRNKKDIFSTLNQGTGCFCFDVWVSKCTNKGLWPIAQFHDEIVLQIPEGKEKETETKLKKSQEEMNQTVNLNIILNIDVQFGKSYSDIH